MWGVSGRIAFQAEASGASAVTGLDVMAPTAEYEAEHTARNSKMRFVRGDVHDAAAIREVGSHQVVWCSGVLYHSPNPLLILERLRDITEEHLLLATETIPEVPGLSQACVFLPGLDPRQRGAHQSARPRATALGVSNEFSQDQGYGAWWWGLSRSAVAGMLHASGFNVVEEYGGPLHITVVATPR